MDERIEFKKDAYPSNSTFQKSKRKERVNERPNLKRVVSGNVTTKKAGFMKRLSGLLLGSDTRSTKSYVIEEILIPATKNMIVETIHAIVDGVGSGFEMLFLGERRGHRRFGGRSSSGSRMSYVGYNSIYNSRESRPQTMQGRYELEDVIIEERGDAEMVLEDLFGQIEEYGHVTVADFYALVGINTEYTDNKYGWSDLRGSRVIRIKDGYMLDLPRPVVIPD